MYQHPQGTRLRLDNRVLAPTHFFSLTQRQDDTTNQARNQQSKHVSPTQTNLRRNQFTTYDPP